MQNNNKFWLHCLWRKQAIGFCLLHRALGRSVPPYQSRRWSSCQWRGVHQATPFITRLRCILHIWTATFLPNGFCFSLFRIQMNKVWKKVMETIWHHVFEQPKVAMKGRQHQGGQNKSSSIMSMPYNNHFSGVWPLQNLAQTFFWNPGVPALHWGASPKPFGASKGPCGQELGGQ